MILVTVGTHHQGFNRLVQAMDELAARLDEPVVIQRGSSSYEPQHAENFQFATGPHMAQLTAEARVVVSHAAAGAIIVALRQGKPLIVVPRLQRFGEVVDDHQLQLAAALAETDRVIAVHEPSAATLRAAIDQVAHHQVENKGAVQLVQTLRQQLQQWALIA
ncbi:MAG: beta-1,4-galactosyltransferase [Anaerolineae bacterium]|nr:beta-1,4-galactosyltransferase [Anaerolineae bacterium]